MTPLILLLGLSTILRGLWALSGFRADSGLLRTSTRRSLYRIFRQSLRPTCKSKILPLGQWRSSAVSELNEVWQACFTNNWTGNVIRHQHTPCCNASNWLGLHWTLWLAYENPRPACHEIAHRGSSLSPQKATRGSLLSPKKPSFHTSIHALDLSTAYVYLTVYEPWPIMSIIDSFRLGASPTESAQATVTSGKPWPSCAGCKVGIKSFSVVTGIPKRSLMSEVTGDCVRYKKSSGGGKRGRTVSYGIYDAVHC